MCSSLRRDQREFLSFIGLCYREELPPTVERDSACFSTNQSINLRAMLNLPGSCDKLSAVNQRTSTFSPSLRVISQ